MAFKVADRVKESTTTSGTGNITLGGAQNGFVTFSSVLSNGDTTYYTISDGNNWEVGLGTYNSSGNTLTRTDANVLQSTNSDNRISLSGSAADVFITLPADKAVFLNTSGDLVVGSQTFLNATSQRFSYLVSSSTQAAFTGADAAGSTLNFTGSLIDVYLNGVRLSKQQGDFTVTGGHTVTISPAANQNDIVEMVAFNVFTDSELVDDALALSVALG
ncbi:MAG: hypothetical protein CMA48_02435 [Euryarchaeota archaeon]|jgi:hypothetical protein|nr:hypothetical protein [Euryarchaeota archaeon]MAQ63161.1 hypothetical protein [Euryarchaeota archaeon]|tara:strand:- start:227 stop:877 length:651 start_codon:yes stop_codon:yes gene_type:complete